MKQVTVGRRTERGAIPAERGNMGKTERSTRVKIPIGRKKTVRAKDALGLMR